MWAHGSSWACVEEFTRKLSWPWSWKPPLETHLVAACGMRMPGLLKEGLSGPHARCSGPRPRCPVGARGTEAGVFVTHMLLHGTGCWNCILGQSDRYLLGLSTRPFSLCLEGLCCPAQGMYIFKVTFLRLECGIACKAAVGDADNPHGCQFVSRLFHFQS